MSAMRPMGEIEEEFDPDVVETLKQTDAESPDLPTPASDATDLHQRRGEGVNVDAPD